MNEFGWSNGVYSSELEEKLVPVFSAYYSRSKHSSLSTALKQFCVDKKLFLSPKEFESLTRLLKTHFDSFGPINAFLSDDSIEEIAVTGLNEPVFIFRRGKGWTATTSKITSKDYFLHLVDKLASKTNHRLSTASPRIDFSNGLFRVHASIAPVCLKQIELTIRRISQKPFSLAELAGFGTMDSLLAGFLSLVAPCDVSVMVAGNTGSGKTTTLNSLFEFVPLKERVLVVEDSPEVILPQENVVNLVSVPQKATLSSLVRDGLRMRPDRLVFGEARSSEDVHALFDSLLSGQAKAAYCTFHADSAQQAVSRLAFHGVNAQDLNALKLLLVQKRVTCLTGGVASEKRVVTDAAEIIDGRACSLFSNGAFDAKKLKSSSLISLCCANYGLEKWEFIDLVLKKSKAFR